MSKTSSGLFRAAAFAFALIMALPIVLYILGGREEVVAVGPSLDDAVSIDHWPMSAEARHGRVVYENFCVGCHGEGGRGDGPAAAFLNPLPRDFRKGSFKFRSTPTGKLPLRDDLVKTITRGLPGSSMPSFELLPEIDRKNVASYVLHLATFNAGVLDAQDAASREEIDANDLGDDKWAEIKKQVWHRKVGRLASVATSPSPRVTPALLEMGRKRYMAECNRCHGDTGRGDGSSAPTLRDWKDERISARDFSTGVFRSGSEPKDLFLRLKTGLNGTPMPSIPGSDEELWALTHFMMSLSKTEDKR